MSTPPFGHFSLSKRERFARKLGRTLSPDPVSKLLRSLLKYIAALNSPHPRDVNIFHSQKARLYPFDNICEKRVFLTPQLWETQERALLRDHIKNTPHQDFYFVDAGANVGLYTLYARSVCMKHDKTLHATCIEPGDIVRSRLKFNVRASQGEKNVNIFPTALSDKEGNVTFTIGQKNLGESRINVGHTKLEMNNKTVKAIPLLTIITQSNFSRIDALKIDIEGHEFPVLSAFFKTADLACHPALIIVEIAHQKNKNDLISLLELHQYTLVKQSRGNCVYTKNSIFHQ